MPNITEIGESADREILNLLYQYSKSLAKKMKQMMENGEISSAGAQPIVLAEEFRNIRPNLPPIIHVFSDSKLNFVFITRFKIERFLESS